MNPKYVATSIKPKIPIVEFIINLPVFTPAKANSPCRILFGIVTTFDKLFNELLTPIFTGDGKTLYTLETGLKIILSNP